MEYIFHLMDLITGPRNIIITLALQLCIPYCSAVIIVFYTVVESAFKRSKYISCAYILYGTHEIVCVGKQKKCPKLSNVYK